MAGVGAIDTGKDPVRRLHIRGGHDNRVGDRLSAIWRLYLEAGVRVNAGEGRDVHLSVFGCVVCPQHNKNH